MLQPRCMWKSFDTFTTGGRGDPGGKANFNALPPSNQSSIRIASADLIESSTGPLRRHPVSPINNGCVVGKPAGNFICVVVRAFNFSASLIRSYHSASLRPPRPQKMKGRLALERTLSASSSAALGGSALCGLENARHHQTSA